MSDKWNDEDRGVLFQREKKKSNYPDMGGNIILSQDLLEHLNEQLSQGEPLKLDIAAWKKVPRSGGDPFLSISVSKPWVPDGDQPKKPAKKKDDFTAPWE